MRLLNLFRKAAIKRNDVEATVNPVDPTLFSDNQAPMTESLPEPSALKDFLSSDYQLIGFNDGYVTPNTEILESNIQKMRADFRKAIDYAIDQKRSKINEIKLHLIRTRGISLRLEEELIHTVSELENLIHELDLQKVLSVENEGLISSPIQSYRLGFLKGVERYNQEKFLAGDITLF